MLVSRDLGHEATVFMLSGQVLAAEASRSRDVRRGRDERDEWVGVCEEGSRVSLDSVAVVLAVVTCSGEGGVGVLLVLDAKFSCWR